MNELKYIESFSKEEIIEKMQNYLNEVETDIENPRSDADDEFVASIKKEVWLKAIQLAKQIDEPQKVKVPAAIGKHIKKRKADGDNFHESILATNSQIYEWYMENAELYEQAWVNGYEVEQEQKWIVCYSTMYLKSPLEPGRIETVEITPKKELAHPFKSYKEAKQQTSLIGGAVEKV